MSLHVLYGSDLLVLGDFNVQSRAINFGRQGHSLTQSKMLHRKTVVNVITYHHIV
jgi:hypothetical protein